MKTRSRYILIAASILTVSAGCIPTQQTVHNNQGTNGPNLSQVDIISDVANTDSLYIVTAPSPNNFISEKIMLAVLATGETSRAMTQLMDMLITNQQRAIGITGKSDEINAATVKGALKQLQKQSASGTVYLITDKDTQQELTTINQNKAIQLFFIDK